jgi:ubiquinone/menaquinone biosynthesis C-methylase UbiE
MTAHFVDVTEIEGQDISLEQLHRTCHRYHWAAREIAALEALEIACGSGLGLALLRQSAARLEAGDFSPEVLSRAREAAPDDVALSVFSAEDLPFADRSFDAVMLFEALYYLPHPGRFFAEAKRVLRPGGKLLLVTCNKDLFDFNPSPYTHDYLGVAELSQQLEAFGFQPTFSGYIDVAKTSARQRILRPLKALAARTGMIPKTMHGKRTLKRLFFGQMTTMPASIAAIPFDYSAPTPLETGIPDHRHKVIYCSATLTADAPADGGQPTREKA